MRMLFSKVFEAASLAENNPNQYVIQRRQLIDHAIQQLSQSGHGSLSDLKQLQVSIEDMRMLTPSSIERVRELLLLLEDKVSKLESVARHLCRASHV